jgi:hypothetical protein
VNLSGNKSTKLENKNKDHKCRKDMRLSLFEDNYIIYL